MITSKNPAPVSVVRKGAARLYTDPCSKAGAGDLIMKEIWKDIHGYEGYYQVSDNGRVRSLDRVIVEKTGKVRKMKGRPIKEKPNPKGYLLVGLSKNGKVSRKPISRLAAIQFIPNPNNLPEINHKDENKENNRIDNLEWCTHLYNIRYGTGVFRSATARKGMPNLRSRGEGSSTAKLRKEDVLSIFYDKRKYKEISNEYGVHYFTVLAIKRKRTWVHLLKNLN